MTKASYSYKGECPDYQNVGIRQTYSSRNALVSPALSEESHIQTLKYMFNNIVSGSSIYNKLVKGKIGNRLQYFSKPLKEEEKWARWENYRTRYNIKADLERDNEGNVIAMSVDGEVVITTPKQYIKRKKLSLETRAKIDATVDFLSDFWRQKETEAKSFFKAGRSLVYALHNPITKVKSARI